MEKIRFYHTPMQKELLIAKIRLNSSLKSIFKNQKIITAELDDEINHRLNGSVEGFYTMLIKGGQGTKKSSTGQTIAKKHDPTFNQAERIAFQYEEHEQHFSNSKPKQTYILDESTFQFGVGSTRLLSSLQEKMETLRKRQNSLIIITPERKYIPEDLFLYTLETIDDALTATCPYNEKPHEPRNCKCYLEKNCKITKAHIRLAVKQEELYIGFYISEIDWGNPDYLEYEKRKDVFMQEIVEGKKKRTNYEDIAESLMNEPGIDDYKSQKSLLLFVQRHKPNLTSQETQLTAMAINILRKKKSRGEL